MNVAQESGSNHRLVLVDKNAERSKIKIIKHNQIHKHLYNILQQYGTINTLT